MVIERLGELMIKILVIVGKEDLFDNFCVVDYFCEYLDVCIIEILGVDYMVNFIYFEKLYYYINGFIKKWIVRKYFWNGIWNEKFYVFNNCGRKELICFMKKN